jgi:iron(III) transport system ATP-binding protein
MRSGAIIQQGESEEIYRRPANLFAARFFCDFNEIPGTVRNGQVSCPVGVFPAQHLTDGPAIVCVRPQGLRLKPAGFCLPGRVVSRRFLGEVDLVFIDVQGVDRPLLARVHDPVGVKEGLDIGIEVDTKDVLVFAASDA